MVTGAAPIAIIALDAAGESACPNRYRFGGNPHVLRQIDMARVLGCETVILLARQPDDEDVLASQHLAEGQGMRFRLVTRSDMLAKMELGDADVILFAPGVWVIDADALRDLLGKPVLLTVDAGPDAPELERLDMHNVWAGGLRMPGALVSDMAILGQDCDPLSALPRIARTRQLRERRANGGLEDGAASAWHISSFAEQPGDPYEFAAGWGYAKVASWFAQRNWSATGPAIAGWALSLAGAIALYFQQPVVALFLAVIAMMAFPLAFEVRRLSNPLPLSNPRPGGLLSRLPYLAEAIAAAALGAGLYLRTPLLAAIYAALVTFAAVMLVRAVATPKRQVFVSGPVLWGIAGLFGVAGAWWLAAYVLTAIALALIAAQAYRARKLTRP